MNFFSLITLRVLCTMCLLLVAVSLTGFRWTAQEITAEDLIGTWQVDLRPTPESDPYFTELVITQVEENTIYGTFYGSPIKFGQVNTVWGKLHFAFVTSDGSTTYNTSGMWVDGELEGTTHALERGFLGVWSAEK